MGPAWAYLPSTMIGTAALISPTAADSYYGNGTTSTNGLGAAGRHAEIVELARALKDNPDLIYEYVRNNIDTVWLYGLHKGALGASIDKAGTSFDQAMLMVEILREAGFTASYKAGTITLNGTQFYDWTGIQNAKAGCQMLSSGGIPASVNGSTSATCSYTGNVTSVTLGHAWVQVNIPGSSCSASCVFDPSYKPHSWKAGINLVSATGMTSGEALTQATSGMGSGTTSGVSYVNNLNATSLSNKLQTYATNLHNYIQNNSLQGAQLEDIISGGVIVSYTSPTGGLRQTSLPYSSAVQHSWSGNIPDQYRTTFRVKGMSTHYNTCSDIIDQQMWDRTFYTDEIYGRLLAIGTDLSAVSNFNVNTVSLQLDGATLDTYVNAPPSGCTFTARGLPAHLVMTVDHPYAAAANGSSSTTGDYMDALIDKPVKLMVHSTIVQGWGPTSQNLFNKWADEQGNDSPMRTTFGPSSSCSAECFGGLPFGPRGDATRAKAGAAWMAQSTRATEMHAAIAGAVAQIHHVVGVVYGDTEVSISASCPTCLQTVSLNDNFDRIDIDAGLSLTSKTADAAARRAGVHAIAASMAALEGSAWQQIADLPDIASTATRFDWGNAPPSAEDAAAAGARNFMVFTSANSSAASAVVLAENMLSSSESGLSIGPEPTLSGTQVSSWRTALYTAIQDYAQAGFTVTASQESFLGPGQRGGTYTYTNPPNQNYTAFPGRQRGGALVATRYSGSEPVEIAHILTTYGYATGISLTKGSGGGATPQRNTLYDPATAADILKSQFVDRSNLLGIDLSKGSLSFTSPAGVTVGNGGFPYALSANMTWHPGLRKGGPGSKRVPTRPDSPWTNNWQNGLSLSSSAMEAMGQSDVRAATTTIAAFLAEQDIYKAAVSAQRDTAAVLSQSWWVRKMQGNVVSVELGASARQFVKLANDTWIAPGSGPHATLTQTGSRAPTQITCGFPSAYALARGWDISSLSFDVTNANGDVQNFDYFLNNYFINDVQDCGRTEGFRLTSWTFPQGMTVNVVYGNPIDPTDPGGDFRERLVEVNNSLGRKISFISTGDAISGFNNGLTGSDLRSVSLVTNADGSDTHSDPASAATKFTYATAATGARPTSQQKLAQVFTADNATQANVEYTYDFVNRVKEVKDAVAIQVGGRNPYGFFIADGTRGERDDPLGNAYAVAYDTYGKPSRFIDELGKVTTAAFDGRDRVTGYTYPEGDQELFAYDNQNNTTSLTRKAKPGSGLADLVISATWNQTWNKPATITNARGFTTNFAYGATGGAKSMLTSATRPDPDGAGGQAAPVYSFTYSTIGKIATATDPTGVVTSNAYAANGNLSSTTLNPGGLNIATSFTYDAQGDVATTTDPRANVTDSVYDADRRKTQDKHHNGGAAAVLNAATRTTYDVVGRVTKTEAGMTFSGSNVSTWATTDQKAYTPTSKVATATDGDNRVVTNAYDDADRLLSVTDPVGRVTRFVYDAAGQTLIEQRAFGAALQQDYATYTYTDNGKQASVKDALGATHTTSFTYDGFDRLATTTFPDATFEALTYDADGDVLTRRNRSNQTLTYTYDNLDRTLTKVSPSPAVTATWVYDGAGRITNLSDTASNVLAYSFDTAKRVTQVATTLPAGSAKTIGYQYDANSNRTRLTWPDGYFVNYAYDTLNRMSSASENGTTTIATYAYNPLSQRTSLAYQAAADTMTYNWTTAGDMLTLAHNLGGTGNDNTYTYTYYNSHQVASDAASVAAWKWQPSCATPPCTDAYAAANTLNQYPSVNGQTISYDTKGNLTGDGVWTYSYDAENRMLTASRTNPIVNATFAYDPLGRRVKKQISTTRNWYLSDGADEIAEYTGITAATLAFRYIPGPAIDQPVAMVTAAGARTYFHTDKRGSVIAMTDSSGNLATGEGPNTYDPYGNVSSSTGTPFKYTGRRLDAETGLYYYRARYYSSALGRFMQTDGVGYSAGMNMYAYVGNDPVDRTDPTGNCPACVPILVGAAIGATVDFGYQAYTKGIDNVDYAEVGVSAVAGGVATYGAIVIGAEVAGSSIAAVATRVAGNSALGSVIGVDSKGATDALNGKTSSRESLNNAGLAGAVGGVFGSGLGEIIDAGSGAVAAARVSKMSIGERNVIEGIRKTTESTGRSPSNTRYTISPSQALSQAAGNATEKAAQGKNTRPGDPGDCGLRGRKC